MTNKKAGQQALQVLKTNLAGSPHGKKLYDDLTRWIGHWHQRAELQEQLESREDSLEAIKQRNFELESKIIGLEKQVAQSKAIEKQAKQDLMRAQQSIAELEKVIDFEPLDVSQMKDTKNFYRYVEELTKKRMPIGPVAKEGDEKGSMRFQLSQIVSVDCSRDELMTLGMFVYVICCLYRGISFVTDFEWSEREQNDPKEKGAERLIKWIRKSGWLTCVNNGGPAYLEKYQALSFLPRK